MGTWLRKKNRLRIPELGKKGDIIHLLRATMRARGPLHEAKTQNVSLKSITRWQLDQLINLIGTVPYDLTFVTRYSTYFFTTHSSLDIVFVHITYSNQISPAKINWNEILQALYLPTNAYMAMGIYGILQHTFHFTTFSNSVVKEFGRQKVLPMWGDIAV